MNYITPPAGDIYCSSLRVCPSVRMSVCNATLVRAMSPRTFHGKNSINNIPTEVVQRKIKNSVLPKIVKFWTKKKTLFEFAFCPGQILVTIKNRDTGIFVVWAKTFPLRNVRVKFAKCQIVLDFEHFLQFYFKNGLFSSIIAHAIFCKFSGDAVWKSLEVRHVNNTGILYAIYVAILRGIKSSLRLCVP